MAEDTSRFTSDARLASVVPKLRIDPALAPLVAIDPPAAPPATTKAKAVPAPERIDYSNTGIVLRFLHDLVDIPAGMARWDGGDWGRFVMYATATGFFMLPPGPPDVSVQRSIHEWLGPDHFMLWTPLGDVLIWAGIWAAVGGSWLYGELADKPRFLESFSLMLEAFSVAEIYQVVPKLLLGREGPKDFQGNAVIRGPAWGWRLFPAGTPSGHAASLYAMIGVATTYFDSLPLTIGLNVFGLVFCTTLVLDDYHFVSDVIWGASMGFYIGRWVVHERSTRARSGEKNAGFLLLPTIDPANGVYALTVAFPW